MDGQKDGWFYLRVKNIKRKKKLIGRTLFTHYLSSRLRQHLLQLKELNGRYQLKEPVQQIAEYGRLDQFRFPDGFISTRVTTLPRMVSTWEGWIGVCKSADPCLFFAKSVHPPKFLFKSETTTDDHIRKQKCKGSKVNWYMCMPLLISPK